MFGNFGERLAQAKLSLVKASGDIRPPLDSQFRYVPSWTGITVSYFDSKDRQTTLFVGYFW